MPYTIDNSYTLAEILKTYDPEGKLHHIIDVFSSKTPILEEGQWMEANGDTYHEGLRLTSAPNGAFTRINEGYVKEGISTVSYKEQLGMIGSLFELDKRLADRQSNAGGWRAQMAKIHIKKMIENWDSKFWFGNEVTDSKEVNGLITRFTPASAAAKTANEHDGVAYDAASGQTYFPVVIASWGGDGLSLLHPKGGKRTFWEDDRGLVDLIDPNGNPYPGYRSYFNFNYGINIGDIRSVQRLFNIDSTNIANNATVPAWFENMLIEAASLMPNRENAVIYCGRQVMNAVIQRMNSKANVQFTPQNVWGRIMPTVWGMPLVQDDKLSVAESLIS